jgi:hypothetical protein
VVVDNHIRWVDQPFDDRRSSSSYSSSSMLLTWSMSFSGWSIGCTSSWKNKAKLDAVVVAEDTNTGAYLYVLVVTIECNAVAKWIAVLTNHFVWVVSVDTSCRCY